MSGTPVWVITPMDGPVEIITVGTPGPQGIAGAAGATGPVGPAGPVVATIVAGEAIAPGQPVYVKPSDGKLYLARADQYPASAVLGLAAAAVAINFAVDVVASSFSLANWTAIVGSASLTVGADYFLDVTPGNLTTVAPSVPGQTVCHVGRAVSTTQLAILERVRILL